MAPLLKHGRCSLTARCERRRKERKKKKKVKASRLFEPLLPHLNLSLNRPHPPPPPLSPGLLLRLGAVRESERTLGRPRSFSSPRSVCGCAAHCWRRDKGRARWEETGGPHLSDEKTTKVKSSRWKKKQKNKKQDNTKQNKKKPKQTSKQTNNEKVALRGRWGGGAMAE